MSTSTDAAQSTYTFNWDNVWHLAYAVIMIAILSIGFLGNALTVIILRRHEHASKSLTPLMLNLSIGSLIIIILGYPVIISLLLSGGQIRKENATCIWSAFVNGTVGKFGTYFIKTKCNSVNKVQEKRFRLAYISEMASKMRPHLIFSFLKVVLDGWLRRAFNREASHLTSITAPPERMLVKLCLTSWYSYFSSYFALTRDKPS